MVSIESPGRGDAPAALDSAARAPRQLLIVWFSRTGASEQLSKAAEQAAFSASTDRSSDDSVVFPTTVRRLRCDQAQPSDLLNSEAYLFISPENLGALAGLMKDFFDRCYYPVLGQIEGRPYAQVISAGSDGQGAARQLARIATGWRLRAVAEPQIVMVGAQTPEQILAPKVLSADQLAVAGELGAALISAMAMGIW